MNFLPLEILFNPLDSMLLFIKILDHIIITSLQAQPYLFNDSKQINLYDLHGHLLANEVFLNHVRSKSPTANVGI